MNVRDVGRQDWAWVLALNAANQTETGPLDEAKLAAMLREACLAVAIGEDAFLIAFNQNGDYDSPNYLWFRQNYDNFIYVDRVVVAPGARRGGLGRALYQHLIAEAGRAGYKRVVCEVNMDPPNPVSDRFHAAFGFDEVGRASLPNGKTVRYLARDLAQ